jgi:hypothetical protein
MGVKNVGICGYGPGNTGVKACYNDIGIPRAIFFVPIGKTYTTATLAALKTAIAADILADNPYNRLFPLQNIVGIEDGTTAPTSQTFEGDGSEVFTSPGYTKLTFQWVVGGVCLLIAMLKASGRNKAFFIIDSYGQLVGTDAGTDLIKGITGYNYTFPFTWAVGSAAVAGYKTFLSWLPEQTNQQLAIVNFNDANGVGGLAYLKGLSGLLDVHIGQGAARAAGVLKVTAFTTCGTVNLHDDYATALAVVGAWRAKNLATGKPIAILSVADDTTNLGWTVTLDTADANYSATAGGNLIGLNGPTELAALGTPVVGYESDFLPQ